MKLVLYSGGTHEENKDIDQILIDNLSPKSPQITYIPSSSYDADISFQEFVMCYNKYKIQKFINMPIDIPLTEPLLREAFNSDIIHLDGGNTYYFLKHLRRQNLLKELKKFSKNGGILTGLSAGAIIMTPTIHTAGFPSFDKDDNHDGIRNLNAMKLVNFEFFPHYKNSKRYEIELKKHSLAFGQPIMACPDGSGIVIDGRKMTVIGKVSCFYKGEKVSLKVG